ASVGERERFSVGAPVLPEAPSVRVQPPPSDGFPGGLGRRRAGAVALAPEFDSPVRKERGFQRRPLVLSEQLERGGEEASGNEVRQGGAMTSGGESPVGLVLTSGPPSGCPFQSQGQSPPPDPFLDRVCQDGRPLPDDRRSGSAGFDTRNRQLDELRRGFE